MVNGVEVEVVFQGDEQKVLPLVAVELEELGYQVKKRSESRLDMRFKGKWFTTDPNKMQHGLSVTPRDGCLVFAYGTGLIASHWTDGDKAWAQQRADEVVKAAADKLDD